MTDYMVVGTGNFDKNGNFLSASVEISVDGQGKRVSESEPRASHMENIPPNQSLPQ